MGTSEMTGIAPSKALKTVAGMALGIWGRRAIGGTSAVWSPIESDFQLPCECLVRN